MNSTMRAARFLAVICLLATGSRAAAATLERTFNYDAARISLATRDGLTEVVMRDAARTFEPGHPDLPLVSETIQLRGAGRVTGVEVLSLETEPLARAVRLPATFAQTAGLPVARSAPDPEWFGRAGYQPVSPVTLGYQGWMRGVNTVMLSVAPVRWDAATGALERIARLRVRLTVEGELEPPLERQRAPFRAASEGAGARDPGAPAGGFEATQIPSLLGSPVDYVIVTTDALASEFQRLADWKTQSGVPAVVRTLSFIEAEYPGGADDAERIRMFIRDAYARWGTEWVLIGGDTEHLPTRYVRTTYYGGEDIACDMYYSCLDGNWNLDGDAFYGEGGVPGDDADLLPEVWVGRAPVSTLEEATLFVDKSLQYVRQPAGDYERNVLFFAEMLFPQNWSPGMSKSLDGAQIAEDCLPFIQTNPSIHYARLYENHLDPDYEPGALLETRAVVLDSLNVGYNVASHIGHGYRNVMSVGDANIDNADARALTNGTRLTNLYASNCTSNAIDFPCIGEAFVLAPDGGAVTNIGSSRFDFPVVGQYVEHEYFKLVYADSVTAVGEAQARQKLPYVAASLNDGIYRWTLTTLLLLGDPELRIYTGTPRMLAVTHPASVSLSATQIAVGVSTGGNPLEGARVTAYKAGDEYASGLTDVAGNVILPFQADGLGDLILTVTGFDCRPYQATVPVTATASAALGDLPPTVVDDGSAGTIGNGNGAPDEGETVNLHIPVHNGGGAAAFGVQGTLSTPNPDVSITGSPLFYGTISAGATANPGAFKLVIAPGMTDQTEVPFTLTLTASIGGPWVEHVQLTVNAPQLMHVGHTIADAGGDNDNRPDPGETVTYGVKLHNLGTGAAQSVTAVLRNHDGLATVTDSTSSFGTIAAGGDAAGDPLVFVPSSGGAILELRVSDAHGLRFVRNLDLVEPSTPVGLAGAGRATSIKLTWFPVPDPDLLGYNVYRATSPGGPYDRINTIPTDRVAYYLDDGLAPLTPYHYKVSAVDSSGNESNLSLATSVSTNPPTHALFPIPMSVGTFGSVAVDHVYPGYPLDIVSSADVLYMWHPDGSAPVDADAAGSTSGDFTRRGNAYLAAPSIADIDGDGVAEIVGVSSNPDSIFTFERDGTVRPGWPQPIGYDVWSSVAIDDLDGNATTKELVVSSNGPRLYAYHEDGSELIDGDANPSTPGVFKVLASSFNFGTPAIADLDGNGTKDIIHGEFAHKLDAWRPDGSDLPGFPVVFTGLITASVAVGTLDGPGDTTYDIVVCTGDLQSNPGTDSVYVIRSDGSRRPGWPKYVKLGGNNRAPSPALADMNNDGYLDVVVAGTNGGLYVFDRDGNIIPPFDNVRYSTLLASASQSSPVVADLDGDGLNDILMGDETGALAGISGTGAVLPGFPILVDAEVKGAAAACDCDGDGMTEIVVAGWDKNVYVWDYDHLFSPAGIPPWPQYNHDAARTGRADSTPWVDTPPPATPGRLDFGTPWPNPARGDLRTWYAIPAARAGAVLEVSVLDLAGRRVRTLERGVARSGRFSVAWDLLDDAGRPASNGVYFLRLRVGDEARALKIAVMR